MTNPPHYADPRVCGCFACCDARARASETHRRDAEVHALLDRLSNAAFWLEHASMWDHEWPGEHHDEVVEVSRELRRLILKETP